MRAISKTMLTLIVDALATIGFFYLSLRLTPYVTGFASAGLAYALSRAPGLEGLWHPGQAIFATGMLYSLAAVYMLIPFAICIEVLRRLIRIRSAWLYAAGATAMMAGYMHPAAVAKGSATATAAMAVILLLAAALGGAAYWLLTIKLRAVVALLLGRLVCGVEPRAKSCVLS